MASCTSLERVARRRRQAHMRWKRMRDECSWIWLLAWDAVYNELQDRAE